MMRLILKVGKLATKILRKRGKATAKKLLRKNRKMNGKKPRIFARRNRLSSNVSLAENFGRLSRQIKLMTKKSLKKNGALKTIQKTKKNQRKALRRDLRI